MGRGGGGRGGEGKHTSSSSLLFIHSKYIREEIILLQGLLTFRLKWSRGSLKIIDTGFPL